MADPGRWHASLNEHRSAWIIACCSIATIFLASTWPDLFSITQTPQNRPQETRTAAQQEKRSVTAKRDTAKSIGKRPNVVSKSKKMIPAVSTKIKAPTAKKSQPKTAQTTAGKTTAASGNYYIQLGAFKEKSRAKILVAKINKHGWSAIIVHKSKFNAVWVGPKNSRNGIENLQKSIQRTLKLKGFIVQKRGNLSSHLPSQLL